MFFGVGLVLDHEIHRCFRKRIHNRTGKFHRNFMQGTIGPYPFHQIGEASHGLMGRGVGRRRDFVGNGELRQRAPLLGRDTAQAVQFDQT